MTTLSKVLNLRGVLTERFILTALAISLLAGISLSLAMFAGRNLDYASGRYPNSNRLESTRLNLQSLRQGYFTQDDAYETRDALMTVAGWYYSRYAFTPNHDMIVQSQCMRLATSQPYPFFQHGVVVMLCSVAHGTSIYISQTVHLGQ
jgi:hypothetical protein